MYTSEIDPMSVGDSKALALELAVAWQSSTILSLRKAIGAAIVDLMRGNPRRAMDTLQSTYGLPEVPLTN